MAKPKPLHFFLSTLLFMLITQLPFSSPTRIKIPLTPTIKRPPTSNPLEILYHLTSQSLSRAHHLKNLNPITPLSTSTSTPLYPRSYGAHSIPLSFGTPPQTTTFVMDTGSSLVWFPCTTRYLCSDCNFSRSSTAPVFIPGLSSSSKVVSCSNPKCGWLYGLQVSSRCPGSNFTTPPCPPYMIQYGLGSTAGLLISDTLDFPNVKFRDFLVGCSILSTRQPEGIAGFGQGNTSLPSQLDIKRFSYCLISHKYDDVSLKSNLVLDTKSKGTPKTPGLNYTLLRKNPNSSNDAFKEYYYVKLQKIIVGDKPLKIPHVFSSPGVDGNGGTIVDSGSTFTYMERPLFEMVAKEFEKQMKNYTVAKMAENRTGLRPCFYISGKPVLVPGLTFQFKGGAKMELSLSNYFALVGLDVACLIIVSDNVVGSGVRGGPSIILGNYQQMNFHVEFDLENGRFGFKRQNCLSF